MKTVYVFVALLFLTLVTLAEAAQFTLTWSDNSTNEDGFIIQRAPGVTPADTAFVDIGLVAKDVKTFVDPGLPPSTAFTYRVCAYNVAGRSLYSNKASGTSSTIPVGIVPPNAPGGSVLTPDAPFVPPIIAVNMHARVQGDTILAMTVTAEKETELPE